MCGDWCYTVRRATPCGLRDGLAAQGRGDRVARFEFSGSLPDEIAGKTRVSCLPPPPPPPAFCRRADRAKGKGGPEDDKETVRQVANRLFCSPAVRDRRRTGDSRRMGDFVGQFRARAGRRDARTPPAGYSRAASVSEPAAGLAWKTASRSSSAPSRSSIGPSMS